MRLNIRTLILIISALSGVAAFQSSAFGQQCGEDNYYWVLAAVGDWSIPENWFHFVWDPVSMKCISIPGVPQADDWAIISRGTAIITGSVEVRKIHLRSTILIQTGSLGANEVAIIDEGTFVQTGGNVNISGEFPAGLDLYGGTYELQQGSLNANEVWDRGTFAQTGGDVTISGEFWLDSDGTYELQQGSLNAGGVGIGCIIDGTGWGTFVQTGGDVTISGLNLDRGTYELQQGSLNADSVGISGTFVQTGGDVTILREDGYGWLTLYGGAYELRQGSLNADNVDIECGTFVQTGGNVTVQELHVGGLLVPPGSEGTGIYGLLGGTLSVGGQITVAGNVSALEYIPVGGINVFVNDGGIINGTPGSLYPADLWVIGSRGRLTGPGTFNIMVGYATDAIYGTNYDDFAGGDDSVSIGFLPFCLTEGGIFSVTQIAPDDFAGGNVPNLLESSVFDVSFDGSFCGEFSIRIPYVWSEVDALGVDETSLVILQETGPETYERLDDTFAYHDEWNSFIIAKAHTFGKFAVQAKVPVILVHGWEAGPDKWNVFEGFLDDDHIPCAKVDLGDDAYPDIRAKILALEIDVIRNRNKWFGKVNLISHSQGGLDARAYLRNLGEKAKDQVHSLVMIGTPNHGTNAAHYRNAYEKLTFRFKECTPWLTPNSVEEFNRRTPLADGVKYYTIAGSKGNPFSNWLIIPFEVNDGVVPVKSVLLTDSRVEHLGTFPYEHNELVTKKDVYDAVKNKIDPPYSEDPNTLVFIKIEDGEVLPSQSVPKTITIDDLNEVAFVLISASPLGLALQLPNGESITPQSTNPDVSYNSGEWLDLLARSYVVRHPVPGVWKAYVTGSQEPDHFMLVASAQDTFVLDGSMEKYFNHLGENVPIKAALKANVVIQSMQVDIIDPNGSKEVITLYDDGIHQDGSPNDGLYGNVFSPFLEGEYTLVFLSGGVVGGREFSRADLESISVVASMVSDSEIDIFDLAILCSKWLERDCGEPDWCERTDLDYSGMVDFMDFATLAEYWLEGAAP